MRWVALGLVILIVYPFVGLVMARIAYRLSGDESPAKRDTYFFMWLWPLAIIIGGPANLFEKLGPACHQWATRRPGKGKHE